jgi:hypothetical protein
LEIQIPSAGWLLLLNISYPSIQSYFRRRKYAVGSRRGDPETLPSPSIDFSDYSLIYKEKNQCNEKKRFEIIVGFDNADLLIHSDEQSEAALDVIHCILY